MNFLFLEESQIIKKRLQEKAFKQQPAVQLQY